MFARYAKVLSVEGTPRLMLSALAGRLPQGMAGLAILLLVRGATRSYVAAGVATGAFAFATAAIAPFQGRLVDRYGRPRVLIPSVLAQAAGLVALVLCAVAHAPAAALIVLSGAAGATNPPVAPTVRALMSEVFSDLGARETAYTLDAIAQELIWVTGPLVVGLVVAVGSPAAAVLLLAGVSVAGTWLFLSSHLVRGAAPPRGRRGGGGALSSHELRRMLVPVALAGLALGTVEVGLPSLALHAGSRPASGLLLSLWSVGSLLGGLAYGVRSWPGTLATRYRWLLSAAVLLTLPLVAARTVPLGAVGALLAGLSIAPMFTCQYALVGRAVLPGSETEAFTWVTAALVGGIAAGNALGGVAIHLGGVGAPFELACLVWALAAAIAARLREPVATAA